MVRQRTEIWRSRGRKDVYLEPLIRYIAIYVAALEIVSENNAAQISYVLIKGFQAAPQLAFHPLTPALLH